MRMYLCAQLCMQAHICMCMQVHTALCMRMCPPQVQKWVPLWVHL